MLDSLSVVRRATLRGLCVISLGWDETLVGSFGRTFAYTRHLVV